MMIFRDHFHVGLLAILVAPFVIGANEQITPYNLVGNSYVNQCPPGYVLYNGYCTSFLQPNTGYNVPKLECKANFTLINGVCYSNNGTNSVISVPTETYRPAQQPLVCPFTQQPIRPQPALPVQPVQPVQPIQEILPMQPIQLPQQPLCHYTQQTSVQQIAATPTCEEGYVLNNGVCYRQKIVDTECTDGFEQLPDGTCRKTVLPECPSPSVRRDGMCVYENDVEPICPPTYVLENGKCIVKYDIKCVSPYVLNERNECVHEQDPTCPYDSSWIYGRCVRTTNSYPLCPPGYSFVNNQCEISKISCQPGYTFNNGQCYKYYSGTVEYVCPANYTLVGTYCYRTIHHPAPPCPVPPPTIPTIPPPQVLPPPPPPSLPGCPTMPVCPPNYNCPPCPPCAPCPQLPPQVIPTQPPPIYPTEATPIYPEEETTTRTYEEIVAPTPTVIFPPRPPPMAPIPPVQNHNVINSPVHVVSNNTNNIAIHISEASPDNRCNGSMTIITNDKEMVHRPSVCVEDATEPAAEIEEITEEEKCCDVVSPRQCKEETDGKWKCYHRTHRRCGPFCTSPKIYLKPRNSMYHNSVLVMPPPPVRLPFRLSYNGQYDCSGCTQGGYRCSRGCYVYECREKSNDCAYEDQSMFCQQFGGQGCLEDDGWFQ